MCCAGTVEVAVEGAAAVVLNEGGRFTAKRNTLLRITFRAGARNEWLADMGIAVVAFLPASE